MAAGFGGLANASRFNLKAMVLAAGAGTRLDPLTLQLPKPLVPVANRPVMEYILQLLGKHGFQQVWANLYHLPDLIKGHFGSGEAFDVQLNYLVEEQLSGDAGGVRACREMLKDSTFLVINGDLLTNVDLSYLLARHRESGALATIGLKKVEDVSQFGVAILDQDGWIKGFQEKPSPTEARSNLVSTGIYILEPAVFDFMPQTGNYGFGRQLFPHLVEQKERILGVATDGYWSDIGTFEQYRQTNFDMLSGNIALPLPAEFKEKKDLSSWHGNNVRVGADCHVQGKLLIGNNSVIGQNVKIFGHVIVGDNCVIEDGTTIHDSIIWSGSHIGSRAEIKNSVIGLGSAVEPGQSLNQMAFVAPEKTATKNLSGNDNYFTASGCSL